MSEVKTLLETLYTLTVSHSTPKDSGVYKVVVKNDVGEATSEATATIAGKAP